MTQQEFDKQIKELKEEFQNKLNKLKMEKIEEPQSKRWKPKYKQMYYYVTTGGSVEYGFWNDTPEGDFFDEWCYLTDNCFETKEETEEYKKQIEYTTHYKNYIEEHSNPLDWDNTNQEKYYAEIKCDSGRIDIDYSLIWKTQGTIYASGEKIIWDAINEIGEDNFKKYVLGVE